MRSNLRSADMSVCNGGRKGAAEDIEEGCCSAATFS